MVIAPALALFSYYLVILKHTRLGKQPKVTILFHIDFLHRFVVKIADNQRRFSASQYGSLPAARASACAFYKAATDLVSKFDLFRGQAGHSKCARAHTYTSKRERERERDTQETVQTQCVGNQHSYCSHTCPKSLCIHEWDVQERKKWLTEEGLHLKGRTVADQRSFLGSKCCFADVHAIEIAIASCASPSKRGTIKPGESLSFSASFDTGNEMVLKTFSSVPDCCQWITKMEVALTSGKFRKCMETPGKGAAAAASAS